MKRNGSCGRMWLWLLTLTQLCVYTSAANGVYYMNDCTFTGFQGMQMGQTVTIIGRAPDSAVYKDQCSLNFRVRDTDAHLLLRFSAFTITDCGVYLSLSGDASGGPTIYGCSQPGLPKDYFTIGRIFTIYFIRSTVNAVDFNFTAELSAVRDSVTSNTDTITPPTGTTSKMPTTKLLYVLLALLKGSFVYLFL